MKKILFFNEEKMRICLTKKKQLFSLLTFLLLFSATTFAQGIDVTGTVTDGSGIPLAGVSVIEKGTQNGVSTDFDGLYKINAPSNATLIFSYVGMLTQEVQINSKTAINIVLAEDLAVLDEIVVVGFGTQSRSLVTSSISTIKAEEIQNSPSVHPVQALEGKVAGLSIAAGNGQPGAGAAVYIRGGTTSNPLSGSNEPLYVIDGVFTEDLIGVNPSDIKSIEVLKDAASTSIYGARGANGVILVTTITGKGVKGSQLRVNYTTGLDTRLNDYNWTSVEDYITISRNAAQRSVNLNSPGARLTNNNFGYSVQELGQQGEYGFERITLTYLDELTSLEGQDYVSNLLSNGYRTMTDPITGRELIFLDNDMQNVRTRTAESHNVNIAMSGASDSGHYNVSLGYLTQEGVIIGTNSNRFNALINGSYNVKENVTLSAQFRHEYQDIDQPRSNNNTINRSSRLPHTYRLWNDDGTPALGESTGSPRNILHELYYRDDTNKSFRNSFKFGLDWEIAKGLVFSPSASAYRREAVVTQFERASREITSRNMFRSETANNQVMVDGLLSYTKTFKEHHNIKVLAGTQYVRNYDESFSGSGANAPTDLISTLGASQTDRERVTSGVSTNKLFSTFGKLDYDYDRKYILGLSIRRDGSSRFAENNRWAVFPSVSAGWNIHEEDFWKSSLLSKLKIRGSWGQAGNDDISLTATSGSFGTTSYGLQSGVRIGNLPNKDLVWETTTQSNIAFDLGFLNNRFNLLVDVYNKETSDRLVGKPLPAQTGFSSITSNFGTLRNRGVEIEVSGTIVKKPNFSWDFAANTAFNKSVITELPENEFDKNRSGGFIVWDENGNEVRVSGLAQGERPNGIWGYQLLGVYATDAEAANAPDDRGMSGFYRNQYGGSKNGGDSNWLDKNGDNIIDSRDQIFLGYRDPNIRGGMVNTFAYKNLSMRVGMKWALGHVINNNFRQRANANARNNVVTITDATGNDIWKNQGDIATIPRYDHSSDYDNGPRNHGRNNTLYFKKGDFLAINEVSFNYKIPEDLSKKLGMKNTSVGLELYNLGYITAYDGLSPEIYDGNDEGVYPSPFQVRFRLTATF